MTDIQQLELRVAAIENKFVDIDNKLSTVVDFLATANSVGGFFQRHGPRVIAFGTGLMTAAGIGNPKVVAFVASFFGV